MILQSTGDGCFIVVHIDVVVVYDIAVDVEVATYVVVVSVGVFEGAFIEVVAF